MFFVSVFVLTFGIPWIQQIIWILYFLAHLLLYKLGYSVCYWFWHEFESVLSLMLTGVIKALVLIEMSIDLLNFWNLPTKMLLCLRKSIVSLTGLHLGIALQRNLPSIAIELLSLPVLGLGIVICCLITIILLPPLRLSCSHYRRLLSEHTSFVICVHQFIEKQPRWTHVLRFIKHVETTRLTFSLTFTSSASGIATCVFVAVWHHWLILKYMSHYFLLFSFILFIWIPTDNKIIES